MFEVSEGDELHYVSEDRLSFGWTQDPVIAIQHLHVCKVGVTDPNYDDGHGKVWSLDYGLSGVGHVCDHAVCQDQQDEVLLDVRKQIKKYNQSNCNSRFNQGFC